MTCICYRSGVLAFDTKVTEGTTFCGKMVKGRTTKEYIMAAAGDCQDIQAFFDWVEKGFKEEDKKKFGLEGREVKIQGIVIDRKGNVKIFEDRLYPYALEAPFYVFGSGGPIALGALEMGASAYRAVKAASVHDTATGGEIKLLSLRKPKARKSNAPNTSK